jgi:hypothetical protein
MDSSFETSSQWAKYHQVASHATEKSFMEKAHKHCGKLCCCVILSNYHSYPITLISQQSSTLRQGLRQQKDGNSRMLDDISILNNKAFFKN